MAVNVAKEQHDMRFDIPCLGPQSLVVCVAGRIAVLAIEAGKTILLEQDICQKLAAQHRLTVTAAG